MNQQRLKPIPIVFLLLATGCSASGTGPSVSDASTPLPQASATSESSSLPSFDKSSQIFSSVPTWRIGLADLDADGDLDAVFANAQAEHSQVWLNDGHGLFTDTGQQLGSFRHGVDVGDVDGDGDPDVVISTHRDYQTTRVYLNDANAVFAELGGAFGTNIGFSVELLDLDGDGDLDAVGDGKSATNIYLNNGAGYFTPSEATLPLAAVWGDLDFDGDVDAFIKQDGVGYSVQMNDGQGSFSQQWSFEDNTAMRLGDMTIGDVDRDGDMDAIITNGHFQTTSYPARVFLNDGTGQFTDSGQQLSAVTDAGLALDDLDGDGDLDLVMTNYMEPCQIWLNNGSGRFEDSGIRFGDDELYRHVHLGDLDGDGDIDIFLATFGTDRGPNEVWLNDVYPNP
jgi:hypothetical protein